MKKKLAPLQQRFVEEYPKDLNATAAAKRAGYSSKTAHVQGPRLLENVGVKAALDAVLRERTERNKATADQVLIELARIGLSDVGQLFDDKGEARELKDLPEGLRRCVASFEIEHSKPVTVELDDGEKTITPPPRLTKVRLWDKPKALELLAKHLRLITERIEVKDKTKREPGDFAKLTLEQLLMLAGRKST
jgi:phage terminase small subunit